MGFFDKVKNMFTEEVEDDVKVEQIKKEVTKVSIETPKVDSFNISEEIDIDLDEKEEEPFSKPVFFDDNDFKDLKISEEIEEKNERESHVIQQTYLLHFVGASQGRPLLAAVRHRLRYQLYPNAKAGVAAARAFSP